MKKKFQRHVPKFSFSISAVNVPNLAARKKLQHAKMLCCSLLMYKNTYKEQNSRRQQEF